MALSVTFDHAQKRVDDDRIAIVAAGREFESELNSGVFVDPITDTLFLLPNCLKSFWYTLNTGDYAKLTLTDFGLSTTDWEARQDQHSAGPWIARKDANTNGTAITGTTYAKNRGFFISWFSYGAGDVFLQLRCGWNSTASISGGVGLEVYSDGTVIVYKGGVQVGSGKITPGNSRSTKTNQVMEMMLLPFRQRELLVYGNGDGFSVLFDDIDEDDADPEITPAQKWWVEVVDGGTQFQTAPLVFNTSGGSAYSIKMSFLEAPATGETQDTFNNDSWLTSPAVYKIYGHPGYGSGTQSANAALTEWDGTAFTPNGVKDKVRLRVNLTTNNAGYTPFVYGAQMGYSGTVANTDATEEHDATDEVTEFGLSVPDGPDGVRGYVVVRDPVALESNVAQLRATCNRPIAVDIGTVRLLDGIGDGPTYDDTHNVLAERCQIDIQDRWASLEQYTFREKVPLDGVTLDRALKFLARRAGFETADTDFTTTAFEIPFQPSGKSGEWGTLIEPGDSAADWFIRLMDTYAGNWVYGVKPTATGAKLFAKSPTDLGTTAAITLYRTTDDAETIGLLTGDDIHRGCYRSLRVAILEPLANDIRVTGINPRTGRQLVAHKADYASMDPTTAPSLRPANWLGFQRPYGLVDPAITTQAAANFAANLIYDRLTEPTEIVEWESTLLLDGTDVPLWRGSNVRLHGMGIYRITSFDFNVVVEISGTEYWRECRYTGIKVADEPA